MSKNYSIIAEKLHSFYEQNKENYNSVIEESEKAIEDFNKNFSIEIIRNLKDSEVLNYIFGNKADNSLFHNLEFNNDLNNKFGSIKGGSSSKRYLFKASNTQEWKTLRGRSISIEDATKEALNFRDKLLRACDYISSAPLNTLEDYISLDAKLYDILGPFTRYSIVRKYLFLLYPDYFLPFYIERMLQNILYRMNIVPAVNYYELTGQLRLIQEKSKIPPFAFYKILGEKFGFNTLNFYQIDLGDIPDDLIEKCQHEGSLILNCKIKEDLYALLNREKNRTNLKKLLEDKYFSGDTNTSKNLTEEIFAFMWPEDIPAFIVKKNDQLLGLFRDIGEYKYSPEKEFPHQRKGSWSYYFSENDALPQVEGKTKIKNKENLLFLYNLYFKNTPIVDSESNKNEETNNKKLSEKEIRFKTGFKSEYPRNLLLFGAPGTGKSFKLNQQKEDLLDSESDYERVTFHPDYSYANFVGTYKPTVNKETKSITYEFVPGPFARIYAKAIKNSKTDEIHPYLLIIEELNRANAAAVFGDIFQLLDRIDNVSEYPVTTSEEFRNYLIEEVGGDETDFESIRLPDNLFIWATMNNADQGVYPIDTAFKRRWNYQPLNINENDSLIKGKYVLLGRNKDQKVEWNKLRKAINDFLSNERINEDKLLGPFFLNLDEIPSEDLELDRESFIESFKNKILIYLFEDAARRKREKLFSGSQKNYKYSDLCEEFDQKGINIFDQEIIKQTEPELIDNKETE